MNVGGDNSCVFGGKQESIGGRSGSLAFLQQLARCSTSNAIANACLRLGALDQYGLKQFLGHIAVWNNPRVLGSENKVGKEPEDSLYKYSSKPDATNMRCVKMSIVDRAAAVFCESRPRQHLDGSGSVFRSRRRNRRCAVCFERCAGSEIRGMGSEKTWNDGIHSKR